MLSEGQVELWQKLNQDLIAKALSELSYEYVLRPELLESHGKVWQLTCKTGVVYRFSAWQSIWDHLWVEAKTIQRCDAQGHSSQSLQADQFFLDIRYETGVSESTLASFLEELYHTLLADYKLHSTRKSSPLSDSTQWPEAFLQGHPKILMNKGRLGWSYTDLSRYAPEALSGFPVLWLAVLKSLCDSSLAADLSEDKLYEKTMGRDDFYEKRRCLAKLGKDAELYHLIPVHPWQWDEHLVFHFAEAILKEEIILLGESKDRYSPQISLRTLHNQDYPERFQLKLALSILNTSSVRGISPRHLKAAPSLSTALREICAEDEELANCRVLADVASYSVKHEAYNVLAAAPYRHREYLGAVIRESLQDLCQPGENLILTAQLFEPAEEPALSPIELWIERSGLSPSEWIKAYAEKVLVPLYHLQVCYGIGLVAHGQNILLVLRNSRPHAVVIKDFQGDLRFTSDDYPERQGLCDRISEGLERLPPQHLIHDLYTGQCVTVLRFVSALLAERRLLSEAMFYRSIQGVIAAYEARHPEFKERLARVSLLAPRMPRILLNKVRFEQGYAEGQARPQAYLGPDIPNPLAL